jgi:hypothetical protein
MQDCERSYNQCGDNLCYKWPHVVIKIIMPISSLDSALMIKNQASGTQVHDQKHTCLLRKNAPTKTKKNSAAVYCRVPRLLFEAKG